MSWLGGLRVRLERGMRRSAAEEEMAEEIRCHLEMEAERLEREEGLSAGEAWRRAVVAFGGVEGHKESLRDGWGVRWVGAVRRDVQVAARGLRRSPGLVAVAVLSLGLAIGLNTAMFSFADAWLLKPLPVPAGERLVHVQVTKEGERTSVSYPDYLEYRRTARTLDGLAAYSTASTLVRWDEQPQSYRSVQLVSENFFQVMGLRAERGRFFLPEEDRTPGTHPAVVISHHLWQTEMGGDPEVIGDTLFLNRQPFTIVGVVPEGFAGAMPPEAYDLFAPMMMSAAIRGGEPLDLTRASQSGWGRLIGRMGPEVTPAQVRAEITAIATELSRADPAAEAGRTAGEVIPVRGTIPEFHAATLPNVLFVMAMVGLVLLVACSNIAGLLLARAASRRHELAVRLSLGAGRWTVMRQLLVEALLLAVPGGLLGFLLAWRGAPLLGALVGAPAGARVAVDFSLDWRILAYATAVTGGSCLLFGLLPALRATRDDLAPVLRELAPSGPERRRLGGAVVVTQVAFAVVLVLTAAVLVRPVVDLLWTESGLDADGVMYASVNLGDPATGPEGGEELFAELLRRLEANPEIAGVETGTATLLSCCADRAPVSLTGEAKVENGPERSVSFNLVSPGLIDLLRIPLMQGRHFEKHDREGAPLVAVVNEAMARRLWPGRDPLGQHFRLGRAFEDREYEVVGVVADAQYITSGKDSTYLFLPLAQNREQARSPGIYIRPRAGDPSALIPLIRTEARALDPDAVVRASSLSEKQHEALRPQRVFGTLFGFCAGVTLLLAALGTYSLLAYSVLRRTREIGIRMALGAHAGHVRRTIVRQGTTLVVFGTAVGLPLGYLGARRLGQMFGGGDAADPLNLVVVALLFLAVAALASWLPARRATRVDPMRSLRIE